MTFQPALHSLRGIAACSVLIFHWEQFFPASGVWLQQSVPANTLLDPTIYIGFGWMGVPLFFILSGWLLGGQLIHADVTPGYLRHFWTRRFLRIYPAVWAELLILLLLAGLIPGLITQASYDTLHLQFLLWLNLPPAMATPMNLVWWTLPVELGFYLFLPLIAWITSRIGWWQALSVALALTMGWRVWIFTSSEVNNYLDVLPVLDSLPGVLFTFMLGFALNFLPTEPSYRRRTLGLGLSTAALLLLMHWQLQLDHVYWRGHWILVVWTPLVAIAIAGLVYCLRDPPVWFGWLRHPLLIWLGHVSFGIYLWHFQVMRAMVLLFPEAWTGVMESVLAFVVAVPITLILASLSFYCIERPLMGWGKKTLSAA